MSNLWIRSQNKETLAKYDRICVSQISLKSPSKVMGLIDNDFGWETLGEYETKERALKVLDEIQSWLVGKPRFIFKNFDQEGLKTLDETLKSNSVAIYIEDEKPAVMPINEPNIVYEMPLK